MKQKNFKKFFIYTFLVLLTTISYSQGTKYSIDEHPPKKRTHLISIIKIFHPDKAAKAARKAKKKDDKKKRKAEKEYQKAKKKYWKHYNKDKDVEQSGGKVVYKRMKKHLKKTKRILKNKPPDPWYKRIFHKRKIRTSKDKK